MPVQTVTELDMVEDGRIDSQGFGEILTVAFLCPIRFVFEQRFAHLECEARIVAKIEGSETRPAGASVVGGGSLGDEAEPILRVMMGLDELLEDLLAFCSVGGEPEA